MFKHLFFSCLLMAVLVPSSVWAAPKGEKVGTIREAHAAFKNNGSGNCAENAEWKDEAKSNTKFRQLDCFKTNNGGAVRLELNDNSSFTINENSLVVIGNLVEKDESGAFRIKLDIQKGYMGFKVKSKSGNEVNFSTGTAAASIRGTEGFIGETNGIFFSSLKEGRLKVESDNGDSIFIEKGQTVVKNKDKVVVLNLKSSGDPEFSKVLYDVLADTTTSFDDLLKKVEKADEEYQKTGVVKTSAADTTQAVEQVADTTRATTETPVKTAELKAPQINYSSYDSLRCVATVTVPGAQNEYPANLSAFADGSSISEVVVKNSMPKNVALHSGIHEYEFVAENEAGRSSVKKTLGCYPMKSFSVKIFGGKYVRLQIPPPPPGVEDVITQTLQFQIRVPENDPNVLKSVVVRQNGSLLLQERLSQIQNLDYQIPVQLKRGQKNNFTIEVIHKSGYFVKTAKVYEVGK